MALLFDGNSTAVSQTADQLLSGSAFCLSFYWKLTSATLNDQAINQFTALTGGIRVALNTAGTTFTVLIGNPGSNVACNVATAVTTGVWQHWFISYDGAQATNATRMKFWKDGVAQTLSFVGTVPATIASPSVTMTMGAATAGASMDGSLSDILIWTGVPPSGLPESQWLSHKPLYHDSSFVLELRAPYDDGVSASDYSGNRRNAFSVSATKSPDSPGISLGHPILAIG